MLLAFLSSSCQFQTPSMNDHAATVMHRPKRFKQSAVISRKSNDTYHADPGVTMNSALAFEFATQFNIYDCVYGWKMTHTSLCSFHCCRATSLFYYYNTVAVNELFFIYLNALYAQWMHECVPERTQWTVLICQDPNIFVFTVILIAWPASQKNWALLKYLLNSMRFQNVWNWARGKPITYFI